MPPVNWRLFMTELPRRIAKVLKLLVVSPPLHAGPSTGSRERLTTNLRFLNYPMHQKSADVPNATVIYLLSGWYYKAGHEWFEVQARRGDGSEHEVSLTRRASPDIQEFFKDSAAIDQRFTIRVLCSDDCVLRYRALDNATIEKSLAELRRAPISFVLGSGHVHIDVAKVQEDPEYVWQWSEVISFFVRIAIITHYNLVLLPILVIGIIAFAASTLFRWRIALSNMCYILAFSSWMLVFLRAALIVLIDGTSFPALNSMYLAPAYFFLVAGAVLSCAAWLQLFGAIEPAGSIWHEKS
jgi:hypothetical protein